MKSVTANALRVKTPGNGQKLGHTRHRPVRGRIEAGNLKQVWLALLDGFDQLDFGRQVIGVIGTDPAQIGHCVWRNAFGLSML